MPRKRQSIPGLDPVRKFPYYKIQYYDERLGVWRDIQKSFESLDSLHQHAAKHIDRKSQTRIMQITEYGKREILKYYTAFGISLED